MKLFMVLLSLSIFSVGCSNATKQNVKENVDHAKMEATSHSKLDDVIRGEKSAVETYDQVLGKIKDKKEKATLQRIRDDHQKAVDTLQKHANQPVKEDSQDAGAWGTFTKAWTGGAKIFGEKTAVKALKQGEEHGLNEYEELLEDDKVSNDLKEMVRTELIPQQKQHIKTLEAQI